MPSKSIPQSQSPKKSIKPKMIVFDLDACLWTPEMYELPSIPNVSISEPMIGGGLGVTKVGCSKHGPFVSYFPSALQVLQKIYNERFTTYANVKIGLASSSEEPTYSSACLNALDIIPGIKLSVDFQQIGRTGRLSSRKTTHFAELEEESGIVAADCLFFDDCGWGDHVADLEETLNVTGVRTPCGLTMAQFNEGLEKYDSFKKTGLRK